MTRTSRDPFNHRDPLDAYRRPLIPTFARVFAALMLVLVFAACASVAYVIVHFIGRVW